MNPRRILIAPDSFGGWQSASEVARRIAAPLQAAGFTVALRPMSDGGEGLLDALTSAGLLDRIQQVHSTGPHAEPRTGPIGWRHGAPVIESSIWLRTPATPPAPWRASSSGLGRVVKQQLSTPGTIGLGGTSTVDMGLGFLQALGARLVDRHGAPVEPTPRALWNLHRIEVEPEKLRGWTIWSDVSTPVHRGAAAFGPQKGVHEAHVPYLSAAWAHVTTVWDRWRTHHGLPLIPHTQPGGGAAGGLGFTLMQLGARLELGAAALTGLVLPDLSPDDLVITGEGRLDATSGASKVVAAVAHACRSRAADLALFVGSMASDAPDFGAPVHVCNNNSDRDIAFAGAVDALVATLLRTR